MATKIVSIISTGEPEKARTGMMYSLNALKYGWMEDVQLFFFGPSQSLLLEDKRLQDLLAQFQALDKQAIACRFLADEAGNSEKMSNLNLKVAYVGTLISDLIKDGYVPMVW